MPADASVYGAQQPFRINTPFENLSAVLQVRQQQESARGLAEQRRALAAQTDERTKLLQQQQADTAAIDSALGQGGTSSDMLARVPGHLRGQIQEQFQKAAEWDQKVKDARLATEKAELGYAAHLASGVLAWEKDGPDALMNAARVALHTAKSHGHDVSELEGVLQADPTKLKPMLQSIIAQFEGPKPVVQRDPTHDIMDPTTGAVIAKGTPKEGTAKPASVQEYEYAVTHDGFKGTFKQYQDEDANRKQKAAAERAPYFTYQPVFDPQGRPISAIRFDARGGPPQVVDVSALTGGGQLKPPPGTTGAQAIGNEVSTEQLDRLKAMFNGGAAAFIGPAEGRARSFGQKIPGVGVNKVFSDFEAATAAFRNSVIKAITGAQMSEREASRIRQQIPDVTDKPQVWLSKAEQTRKNLADLSAALAKKNTTAPKGDPLGIR